MRDARNPAALRFTTRRPSKMAAILTTRETARPFAGIAISSITPNPAAMTSPLGMLSYTIENPPMEVPLSYLFGGAIKSGQ